MNIESILDDPGNAELPNDDKVAHVAKELRAKADHAIDDNEFHCIIGQATTYLTRMNFRHALKALQILHNGISQERYSIVCRSKEFQDWFVKNYKPKI